MAEIKDTIKQYVKLDEEIKDLSKVLKELRDSKKKYSEEIIKYLQEIKEGSVIHAGTNIFRLIKRKTSTIDKTLLKEAITKNTNSDVADTILDEITVEKESVSLKRTKETS